jgi:UDP-glucose 4-epimerase
MGGLKLKNILVTGGAGFIGSHLVESLVNQGAEKIIVLDNLSCGHKENVPIASNISFVQGDIRNASLVDRLARNCDTIFHLAEYIPETKKYGPGHVIKFSAENPIEDFDVNTRGTLIVLEAARRYNRKVIFTSTAAVYGKTNLKNISEEDGKLPVSPYGASKFCSETYVSLYSRAFGVPGTIARFFNVYGPRQRKYVMYDMLLKLSSNPERLEVLGNGKESRDFVYVQDAVDALLLIAADPQAEGQVFNVGTGIATSILDVVRLLKQILQMDTEIEILGKSWPGDLRTITSNIDKLRSLGYKPKFSVEEGLKKLVSWFLESASSSQVNSKFYC